MSNKENIISKLGNIDDIDDIETLELPNFVRKDGLLCEGGELNLCKKNKKGDFMCDKSECLMNSEEKILIDHNNLSYTIEPSVKEKIDDIYNKIDKMKNITLTTINNYNENSKTQNDFYEKNEKIRSKLNNDLKMKNKIVDNKKNNFRIEYDKIEELNNNIENSKKLINQYLKILKYLIPILILIIICFIILQSGNLF